MLDRRTFLQATASAGAVAVLPSMAATAPTTWEPIKGDLIYTICETTRAAKTRQVSASLNIVTSVGQVNPHMALLPWFVIMDVRGQIRAGWSDLAKQQEALNYDVFASHPGRGWGPQPYRREIRIPYSDVHLITHERPADLELLRDFLLTWDRHGDDPFTPEARTYVVTELEAQGLGSVFAGTAREKYKRWQARRESGPRFFNDRSLQLLNDWLEWDRTKCERLVREWHRAAASK